MQPQLISFQQKNEMKAAVIYPGTGLPEYIDISEPVVQNDHEILVRVRAVAIKHFDKSRAVGNHYSSDVSNKNRQIPGGDGVCLLPDGTRVYAIGVTGMMAEKGIIDRRRVVEVPDELDDVTAAALPNAVIGAAMALKFKADIHADEVVLINGATGFTGRLAVQIAKHYGAKKVIASGRNPKSLEELLLLGADEVIQLEKDEQGFATKLRKMHSIKPIDVIIDYLWGRTAEIIVDCLKGRGLFTNRMRYVSVGSVTGDIIRLSAASLRSANIQLIGSGLGAWSRTEVEQLFSSILPEMFSLAIAGKLQVQTVSVQLNNIADLWNLEVASGQRLVVTISD